jgi:hypothetical protein
VSECESFSSRRVKAVNVPARISPHQPVPIAEALSAKTSCALIPSGDSFRVCRAFIGPWLSLVERLVRDEEVASSNLAGPTNTQCLRSSAGEVRTSVRLPARSAQPGVSQTSRARRRRDNLAGPTNTQCLRSSAGEVRTSVRLPARSAQPGASQIFVASVSPPAGFKGPPPYRAPRRWRDARYKCVGSRTRMREWTGPSPEALLALNACSDGGEAPIWPASWNVLMAGKLRIYVRL